MGAASEVTSIASEQEITGALVRLAHPGSRTVYFLTGHGERDLQATDELGYDQLRQAAGGQELQGQRSEPPDHAERAGGCAGRRSIAGPTAALFRRLKSSALTAYLEQGGGLVVLVDPLPSKPRPEPADPLAALPGSTWGVDLRPDLVVDLQLVDAAGGDGRLLRFAPGHRPAAKSGDLLPRVAQPGRDTLGRDGARTNSSSPDRIPGARPIWKDWPAVSIDFDAGPTSPDPWSSASWARMPRQGGAAASSSVIRISPPMPTSSVSATATCWSTPSTGPRGQESLISLTPKQTTQRFVTPPSRRRSWRLVFLLTVVVIPGLFLILGLTTWWSRRARA